MRWPGWSLWSPGEHYLADALAALAVGRELGFAEADLVRGPGVVHRDEAAHGAQGRGGGGAGLRQLRPPPDRDRRGPAGGRALAGEGRLVVAFQPHLVSRTRIFGTAMGEALGAADEVVVLDVYLAREDADPAVTGALVADAVPLPRERVAFVSGIEDAARELAARARPGDLVLTLGAGDVTRTGPRVLELPRALRGRRWLSADRPTRQTPRSARGAGSRAASGAAAGSPGATSRPSWCCSPWSAGACTPSTSRPGSPCRGSRSRAPARSPTSAVRDAAWVPEGEPAGHRVDLNAVRSPGSSRWPTSARPT